MPNYLILNNHTKQIVPTICENLEEAKGILAAFTPNLGRLDASTSKEDFSLVLTDLGEWGIISFEPMDVTGVTLSGIKESPAWKNHMLGERK